MITDPEQALENPGRYIHIIAVVWISSLIWATVVSPKLFQIGPLTLSVYVFVYPVSYICSDLFTEVYGYRRARQIVWTGLGMLTLTGLVLPVLVAIPAAKEYADQEAFEKIFAQAPIFTLAALCAFFTGEMFNSFTLAKMKILQKGRHYHIRSLFSSLVGQTMDQLVYVLIGFVPFGLYSFKTLASIVLSSAVACVIIEAIKFPVSGRIMHAIKKVEKMDVYDIGTDFNPFTLLGKSKTAMSHNKKQHQTTTERTA